MTYDDGCSNKSEGCTLCGWLICGATVRVAAATKLASTGSSPGSSPSRRTASSPEMGALDARGATRTIRSLTFAGGPVCWGEWGGKVTQQYVTIRQYRTRGFKNT